MIRIDILGPEPPCVRCKTVNKNVEEAAKNLKKKGVDVKIVKQKINSKDVVSVYGVLVSPALAINGTVKFMGRIPSHQEIEKEILKMV